MQTNELLKNAIAAAQKKAEEEAAAKKVIEDALPKETRRLFIIRNVIVNSVIYVWQRTLNYSILRATQLKIKYFVHTSALRRWIWWHKEATRMWIAGYRKISADDFIKEFPPKKGHKPCRSGQGWMVVQLPNKQKVIRFCTCVTEKYKKSGKKYLVKQPGEK